MKAKTLNLAVFAIALALIVPSFSHAVKPFTHRFIYADVGMAQKTADTCLNRMRAAASLGYNGFIVTNWEHNNLESQSQIFLDNVKRQAAEAKKLDIALIPRHFYQADASYDNFNLSEAFPVRGTKFMVANGRAKSVGDHDTGLKNGGFESGTTGWKLINLPNAGVETSGPKSGKACLRLSGGGAFSRIQQKVNLVPFRAYRLSAWVSTKGFSKYTAAKFRVSITDRTFLLDKYGRPFGTPRDLHHKGVWSTLTSNHGWKYCQTDFNSLHYKSATLEFVVAHSTQQQVGTLWLDDVRLEEVGLYETVRSRTRPITVTNRDGSVTYKEGTDYIVDPKCNKFTIESFWYQGDLEIPHGSAIENGDELRVDWYQMSDVQPVYPDANYCLSETRAALKDNLDRIDNLYGHNKWMFMGFDEWRVAFWDDRCELYPKAKTAGDYMAGAMKMSTDLLWGSNSCREMYVWSDMYDPYHNAWKPYAITNGGCLESWKDLDTNIIIMNWNACGLPWYEKSVRFYMGVDDSLNPDGKVYRQILSVMDGARVGSWLKVVNQAEKEGGRGVIGINYVNWDANFNQMVAVKNACLAYGRWGNGPLPKVPANRCVKVNIKETASPVISREHGPALSVSTRSSGKIGFAYKLSRDAHVSLQVVDLQGRLVKELMNQELPMGKHEAVWQTGAYASGVYFLRLKVDGLMQKAIKQILL